jgi:hypothetical protein
MKKIFITSCIMYAGITFGQFNYSNNPITDPVPSSSLGSNEIFRFQSGAFTQLQGSTTDFTFGSSDRWLSIGEVPAGSQTFYGSRFQYDGSALVTGYTSLSPNNPRIQWIGNSASTSIGNLEFRVGDGFGSTSGSGINTLVASMTPEGNTYFGTSIPGSFALTNTKVGIAFEDAIGFQVSSLGVLSSSLNPTGASINIDCSGNAGVGLIANVGGALHSTGLFGKAFGPESSIGVFGLTPPNTNFSAAIYGDAQVSGGPGSNLYAGYFNGDIATTAGFYQFSDAKLKENVIKEKNSLERIVKLRPVSYSFKKVDGIALAKSEQHGFISQEMAEVFPELTKDILHPVMDEEGKVVSEITYKAINYVGLISVLTSGIQELNTELQAVRQELNEYKANDNVRIQLMQNNNVIKGYSLEQNSPNPFSDRSVIRYKLVDDNSQATISIFNLNGGFVKEYPLEGTAGEITVLASEIGKGMFIYSLTVNGQEMISKRMIVK